MSMKQVLDRGRLALEKEYASSPVFVARMLYMLSGPYIELGETATAAEMARRAHEIGLTIDDPDVLASTSCGMAYDSVEARDLDQARAHLSEAARQVARMDDPPVDLLVECAVGATMLAEAERNFDEAIEHARHGVELLERSGDTSTTRFTSALNNLAHAYGAGGRLRESIATQRRVTEVSASIGRGNTIGVVISLNNEGAHQRTLGWWLEAARSFERALEIARGLDQSGTVPPSLLANYGRLLLELGRAEEGAALLRTLLEQPGASQRYVVAGRLALATLQLDVGDVDTARVALESLGRELDHPSPKEQQTITLLRARLLALDPPRGGDARELLAAALEAEGYPSRSSQRIPELLEHDARLALGAGQCPAAAERARASVGAYEALVGLEVSLAY
jgi:tetratricopeptide (TPR) repeat protein